MKNKYYKLFFIPAIYLTLLSGCAGANQSVYLPQNDDMEKSVLQEESAEAVNYVTDEEVSNEEDVIQDEVGQDEIDNENELLTEIDDIESAEKESGDNEAIDFKETENAEEPAEAEPEQQEQPEGFSYDDYAEGYAPGMVFPNFTMTDSLGNPVNLNDYRGKALYLNFFTTWCPYCFYEIPDMELIASQYGDDVTVLLVDLAENAALAGEYAKTYGISLPINNYPDWNVGKHNINGVPESFVLDKHSIIVDCIEGMADYEWMDAAVSSAVSVE